MPSLWESSVSAGDGIPHPAYDEARPDGRLMHATETTPPQRGLRIVVADDTPEIRALLSMLLRRAGHHIVAEAGDGEQAVARVDEFHPDAIVLDLSMPVLDGLQAIPLIRTSSPDTKIVVMSGFLRRDLAEETKGLGAVAYVEKGTRPDDLLRAIEDACLGERARIEPAARAPNAEPALGDVLSVMTHELANSVAVVAGLAETLRKRDRLSEDDIERCLDGIIRGSDQLRALVQTFSDVRCVLGSTMVLDLERTDVASVIEGLGSAQAFLSRDATPRALIDGDIPRLRRTLDDLIAISTRHADIASPMEITMEIEQGTVAIAVADRGPTIPADARETLFDNLTRLDGRGPGDGLRLFVARGVARAHGGDLAYEDDDAGARFVLRLPLVSPRGG